MLGARRARGEEKDTFERTDRKPASHRMRSRTTRSERHAIVDEPLPPDTEWALIDPSTGKAAVVIRPDEPERCPECGTLGKYDSDDDLDG